jgi:hypothetical protein
MNLSESISSQLKKEKILGAVEVAAGQLGSNIGYYCE